MRGNGILMHLSSLPSSDGIGTLGQCAYDFSDFLKQSKQTWWQLLPICPTGYGDSPYQSFSTFAGNPYFIDLDLLCRAGYLLPEEYTGIEWSSSPGQVDYGILYEKRYPVLRKAVKRFLASPEPDYADFCRDNTFWLEDYALFMALKNEHGGMPWNTWEVSLRNHDKSAVSAALERLSDEVTFYKVLQYLFFTQWTAFKTYTNGNGISLIGDLPIYVAYDSADVWAHPELFQLDEDRRPIKVAGCPPDGFSATGQLWGNPLFDWNYMERTGYDWWIRRITYLCSVYDILRIDHFRGFDSYYTIPYGSDDACGGTWEQGPGMKLFQMLNQKAGRQHIIAEDLGFLTDSVRQLLADSGFPGMKVLELAFDSRDATAADYLPHNFIPHCVAYAGTHDNDTINGWFTSAAKEDTAYAKDYMALPENGPYHWNVMKCLWASSADMTIVQAQDLLGLGSDCRMNTPSTANGNWRWRAREGSFTEALAEKLAGYMKLYER